MTSTAERFSEWARRNLRVRNLRRLPDRDIFGGARYQLSLVGNGVLIDLVYSQQPNDPPLTANDVDEVVRSVWEDRKAIQRGEHEFTPQTARGLARAMDQVLGREGTALLRALDAQTDTAINEPRDTGQKTFDLYLYPHQQEVAWTRFDAAGKPEEGGEEMLSLVLPDWQRLMDGGRYAEAAEKIGRRLGARHGNMISLFLATQRPGSRDLDERLVAKRVL